MFYKKLPLNVVQIDKISMHESIMDDKLRASAIREETRQFIEYLNNNGGKSDLNEMLENLDSTEHFYEIYSGLIGADILEDIEENGGIILKLKSINTTGTADMEIQTEESEIYGDIELELDEKMKTMNCHYCANKYPLYDWPIYVRHVEDVHFNDDKSAEQLIADDRCNEFMFEDIIELDAEENRNDSFESNDEEAMNNSFGCAESSIEENVNQAETDSKILKQFEKSEIDKPLDFDPLSDVDSLESVDFDQPLNSVNNTLKLKPADKGNRRKTTKFYNLDYGDMDASEDEIEIYSLRGTGIFFKHTKPELVIAFLELLQSHPILWEIKEMTKPNYFQEVNKMVDELNRTYNEHFTWISVVQGIKRLYDWYSKVLYSITNSPNPDNDSYVFREYFEKCLEFWPIHYMSIPCAHCDETQNTEIGHQIHLSVKHGIGKLPYECKRCDVQFQDQGSLNKHKSKHPPVAREPQKRIKSNVKLPMLSTIESMNISNQTRNLFGCHVCGKIFPTRSQFTKHKYIHMDRKYECDICHRKYSRIGKLNSHKRGHELTTCELCGKTMLGAYKLKEHILGEHEGKIACIVCNQTYTERSQLRYHQIRQHFVFEGTVEELQYLTRSEYRRLIIDRDLRAQKGFYECKKCNRMFKWKSSYIYHLNQQHPNVSAMHRLKRLQQKTAGKFVILK